MSPEVRIIRIKEQIAHLKVLLNVSEEALAEDHRVIAQWTKKVLMDEAQVATFKFRIHDFEDELDELTASISKRKGKAG
jgi:hypothetical protein